MNTATALRPGRGLDIGTMNLVSAGMTARGGVVTRRDRNAFLEIPADALGNQELLTRLDVPYVMYGDRLFVLGEAPDRLRNLAGAVESRALPGGILSPTEKDAIPISGFLFERLLGKPIIEHEPVAFSVPAAPIDWEFDAVCHEGITEELLKKLGFAPTPVEEAHAVVYSELSESDFTGLAISFGGQMTNVCLAHEAEPVVGLSLARGGEWVDEHVSRIMGIQKVRAGQVRENDLDLDAPRDRLEQAVARYCRGLIRYVLQNFMSRFELARDSAKLTGPIDVVLAGGASLLGGLPEVVKSDLLELGFSLPLAKVRRAEDPTTSVARGCLMAAAL